MIATSAGYGGFSMYDIEEHAVFAKTAGLALSKERLEKLAVFSGTGAGNYADCRKYRIEDLEYLSKDLLRLFRITPALVQRWRSANITFQICLFTREGVLIGGRIEKHIPIPGDLFSIGFLTAPTRQEIRIAGRIFRYLTEKDVIP